MNAASLISKENVDMFPSILSSVDTLANSWLWMGKEAYEAGTKLPICAMTAMRATDRIYVLLPLILQPVTI